MTTAIKDSTRLDVLDYDIIEEPLRLRDGTDTKHKALRNGNTMKVMSVVTSEYVTLPNRKTFLPMLSEMQNNGWRLADEVGPRGGRRRSPIIVEAEGARIGVEMFHPDFAFTLPSKHAGANNKVFARALLSTSHDRSRAYRFSGGLLEQWCTNGATRPIGRDVKQSIRHMGDAENRADYLATLAGTFLNNLGEVEREYRIMADTIPGPRQKQAALELVLVGKGQNRERDLTKLTLDAGNTAWEVYQKVTSRLTHFDNLKGRSLQAHETIHRDAIGYLMGTKTPPPVEA